MTEKEKLIARLNELGEKLNREVSTSGTIQELAMRIAELEEELDESTGSINGVDGNLISSAIPSGEDSGNDIEHPPAGLTRKTATNIDLVSVETLVTLHIDALHATRNEPVSIVEPGAIIRVSEQDADELDDKGLARKV
ncbi:DNA-packaging protein [Enterobacter sp. RHBSTW-00994]|uniref:DNA-packaging protein FI n=1 Tax=Enterobacter sp. RHBSTW-00994 TaxID=2742676 RepID=UPI0015EAD479|nr:DNA-packaging protein FI [Enterobacter sp. RHBSTW-00994]QLR43690.1 DNA-packaging protein [Enterobacter sp. RHBSTW-00994]